jgi:hypothetical protein
MNPADQTRVLSELAACSEQAAALFARADLAVRQLRALGMAALAPDGTVTVNVDDDAFDGSLSGCDARDVKGLVRLFGAISQIIGVPVDDGDDGRKTGDALLRLKTAHR